MSSGNLLFVYGTLKRGGEFHSELTERAHFVGAAKIQGKLFRIQGESYPGAIQTDSMEYIHGELYELAEPEMLAKIDDLEECDRGLFTRKLVDAWIGKKKVKAWAYFYAKPTQKTSQIVSGHFPVGLDANTTR